MASSSHNVAYDPWQDPDVPCGSSALNGKWRRACSFKCCIIPVEVLNADSKNASVDASPAKCVAAAAHNTTPISQAATDVDSQAGSQVDSNPSTTHSSSSGGAMILLEDSKTRRPRWTLPTTHLPTLPPRASEAHSTITSQSAASVTKTA